MAMSKRKRAQVIRWIQYAILLAVVLVVVLFADWGRLSDTFFNLDDAKGMFPEVITTALVNTALYTSSGFALGLVLGLVLALMRLSPVGPYRWISGLYVEIFRGLPALLVLLTIGYGIPLAFPGTFLDKYTAVMIGLAIVSSAYIGETLRAGIQAVPKGQIEAARSLGMSRGRTTFTIVIPQAFKIILPPLTNELIMLTKDSSLAYVLGASLDELELTQFARQEMNAAQSLTPFVMAGLCYLVITIPLSYLSRYLERRTGGTKISTPESTEVKA
jgi:polar amino acid transport system permease protein